MQRSKNFLTTGEVSSYCAVSHLTVANWIRAGKLTASRTPGGHWRVQREDFVRFLTTYSFPIPQDFRQEGDRVVVVDDDRPLAELIAATLRQVGYQVSVAFDGYEAGVKMATLKPDLLVLDLIMPGIDGFSVCKRVRAEPATRGTKILAIAGLMQEGGVAKALECGADACLEKPFRMEILKEEVAKLLAQRRSEGGATLGMDRRRSQRVPVELPVVFTPLSVSGEPIGTPQQGKLLNGSREGILVALDTPLDPLSLVALQIFLKGNAEPIHAVGEGKRVSKGPREGEYEAGIEFIAMDTSEKERWLAEVEASR